MTNVGRAMRPVLLLAATLTAPALATEPPSAPLPAYFVNETSHGDDDDYRPMPNQRGLYAHGVAGIRWSRETDGAPCKGSETEQDRAIRSIPFDGTSEFWFYRTRTQGILLTRVATFDTRLPCDKALSYRYEAERAYVADGFIHSMGVDDRNSMEPIGSWPSTHSAGAYSSGFERIQSLMARPKPGKRDRSQGRGTVAGARVVCRGVSGLVWSSVCLATSGPARGMTLSATTGDDERTLFSTVIDDLRPDATIPGILFEIDRTWRGKE